MRGKDSGSEHEHETAWARPEADAEGSATPPTPPPSFGQTPPGSGQLPADDGTAWAPDAVGAYPTRYGPPGGGLRAPEPAADDPESTNRFRAIPAYGPPPAPYAGALPAPRQPAHGAASPSPQQPEGQGVHMWQPPAGQGDQRQPAYGPPSWQPPAPMPPSWQPPVEQAAGPHSPTPGPGTPPWQPPADPNAAHPPQAGPAAPYGQPPAAPNAPGWEPVPGPGGPSWHAGQPSWPAPQPPNGPAYPQLPPPPGPQQAAYGPGAPAAGTGPQQPAYGAGTHSWQPAEGPPAWQPPAEPGTQAWQPHDSGAQAWPPPAHAAPLPWQAPPPPGPGTPQAWSAPVAEPGAQPGAESGVTSWAPPQWPQGPGQAPAGPATWPQPAGGQWAAQPGESGPGVPSFPEWGPAPATGQPSGGEAWPRGHTPAAEPGAVPAAPAQPQVDAYAQEITSPDAVRPGEPGDVPVWPPRLPGEPYPQGEVPAGTSWPPVEAYRNEPGAAQASETPSGASGHDSPAGQGMVIGASGQSTAAPDAPRPADASGGERTLPVSAYALTGDPYGGGSAGPGTPADEQAPPAGPAQDAPPASVPDAPASYPPAAGHGEPPASFGGAEIAHAVTPPEGTRTEGLPMPGAPQESGPASAYPAQSTAHGEPQHASPDGTTQPLAPPQPEEPFHTATQTPNAPSQAHDSAPSGIPLGGRDEPQEQASSSDAPSEPSPAGVPSSAAPSGAASSQTPPPDSSANDGAGGADSPDPSSGQMATTSPPTGSPAQPTGETPFAFTPVKPAKAGKPAPPPGFGPEPSTPGSNLPATLGPTGSPSPGGKVKRILMAAGAVVAVGAIGTAAFFAYAGESDGDQAARTRAATTAPPPAEEPQPSSTIASAILDSEQTDPKTLKQAEAFPDEKVTVAGRTYRRVKVDVTDDCEKAATGAFAKALAEQQCRRVLRATYVDGKRQYAVTTGIAVLPGKTEALAVDQTKDLGANVWFRGLDGSRASGADKVSISGGYAAGMVWGRYIVFSYATYADGHTPAADDKVLGPISSAFRDNTRKVIEKRAAR